MLYKSYRKNPFGFTLIELLVVIAIIGVLSAVVLAALNTARNKGNDAAVKSDLSVIPTQAASYFGDNGAYSVGGANKSLVSGETFSKGNCAYAGGFLMQDTSALAALQAADQVAGGSGNFSGSGTVTPIKRLYGQYGFLQMFQMARRGV